MSKERESLQRCDHLFQWNFVRCLYDIPQYVTDMYCERCGEYWWRPFDEKREVFGDFMVIREGSLIEGEEAV